MSRRLASTDHLYRPAARGYAVAYHAGEVNRCPGCGRSQWHVGRFSAECAFCAVALPLAVAGRATPTNQAGGTEHV